MTRHVLDEARLHPAIRDRVANRHVHIGDFSELSKLIDTSELKRLLGE